ncbi:MAG TPA: hypothetical protein VKR31_00825 [Rhizomicrobium sp.]|nr:hypothetical protein [Rhizomicrobium sp.]
MADDIGVIVTGDREIADKFDRWPSRFASVLFERITGLTDELYARIEGAVPRRTGRLAGEIVEKVRETDTSITGSVSVSAEFAKAGALEYGGTGKPFRVRAHEMRLSHLWARATAVPMMVSVPEHSRVLDISARRFMRGPLESMRSEVTDQLQQAVDEAGSE